MVPRRPLAAVLVALTLVGCTTASPAYPTPTAQPSPRCTPEAGGTPYPCGQTEYEQMQERARLYAEAETLYRRSVELRNEALTTDSANVEALVAIAQGQAQEMLLADLKADETLQGSQFTAPWVNRLPDHSREGSVVALESCVDSSAGTLISTNGERRSGYAGIERTYYGGASGSLKMLYIESKLVDQC